MGFSGLLLVENYFCQNWIQTYNSELLAIVEAFKTWQHYLEDCKYKVLVLTNHNNL